MVEKTVLTTEELFELANTLKQKEVEAKTFNKAEQDRCYKHFERYILLAEGGKIRVVDVLNFDRKWEEQQAQKYFANFKIQVMKTNRKLVENQTEFHIFYHMWLSTTTRYDKLIFDPRQKSGPIQEASGTWIYNRWTKFPFDRNPAGDATLFYKYLFEQVCDEKQNAYDYVLDWMAALFQKPWEKNYTSLVFSSQMQGSGKSVFGDILCKMCSPFSLTIGVEQLLSKFNDFLRDKLIVFVDENLFFQKRDIWNKLKKMISDSTQNVEEKGVSPIVVENYMRFIFAANEEVSVGLETNNRRYQTIMCKEKKYEKSDKDKMIAQLENGGYEKLMDDLLNRAIDNVDFTPRIMDISYLSSRITTLLTEHPAWVWLYHCAFSDIAEEYNAFLEKKSTKSGATYYKGNDHYFPFVQELWTKYISWCGETKVYQPGEFHKFSMDIADQLLEGSLDHKGGRKRNCSISVIPEMKMRLAAKILGRREEVSWLGGISEIEKKTLEKQLELNEVVAKLNLNVVAITEVEEIEKHRESLKELVEDIERLIAVIDERKELIEEQEKQAKEKNDELDFLKTLSLVEGEKKIEKQEESERDADYWMKRTEKLQVELEAIKRRRLSEAKAAETRKEKNEDAKQEKIQAYLDQFSKKRGASDGVDGIKAHNPILAASSDEEYNISSEPVQADQDQARLMSKKHSEQLSEEQEEERSRLFYKNVEEKKKQEEEAKIKENREKWERDHPQIPNTPELEEYEEQLLAKLEEDKNEYSNTRII